MSIWQWLNKPRESGEAWMCSVCSRTFFRRASCEKHVEEKHGGGAR